MLYANWAQVAGTAFLGLVGLWLATTTAASWV
jgi:hypothetical protein